MRIGVFGGTFDPVHYGHLLLAEYSREMCQLDRVLFVPAAVSPHKLERRPTADAARVDMLRLAIAANPAFEISTMELDRGGVSYTVETLRQIRLQHASPDDRVFFLMGADSLDQFSKWHKPDEITQLACLVIVARPGTPEPNLDTLAGIATTKAIDEIRKCQFTMPRIEFSSSTLRRRVHAGQSIRYQTPAAVEAYIRDKALYE